MKVLIVEPEKKPYRKEVNNSLEELQNIVGGIIEAIYPFDDQVALICNEEGKLIGLPLNRELPENKDIICGTFFICGSNEDNFKSLTENQFNKYYNRFESTDVFLRAEDKNKIIKKNVDIKKRFERGL